MGDRGRMPRRRPAHENQIAHPRGLGRQTTSARPFIEVVKARQNNLKDVSVRIPIGAVTAVTGVAGACKSSLAFDVLYAEGHRRYAETFSPYARQFLERLDRPRAERIEGVLPAVAVDRTAPVRTSRSTVGTMTSVADYLRALYARAATLHCRQCGEPVARDTPSSIFEGVLDASGRTALVTFPHRVGEKVRAEVVRDAFEKAGLRRVLEGGEPVRVEDARLHPEGGVITVVFDRIVIERAARQRIVDSIEGALRHGLGKVALRVAGERRTPRHVVGRAGSDRRPHEHGGRRGSHGRPGPSRRAVGARKPGLLRFVSRIRDPGGRAGSRDPLVRGPGSADPALTVARSYSCCVSRPGVRLGPGSLDGYRLSILASRASSSLIRSRCARSASSCARRRSSCALSCSSCACPLWCCF